MSNPEQREEAIFEAARLLQGPGRSSYLESACAGDLALRERIEGLLGALERAGDLLNEPAVRREPTRPIGVAAPRTQPRDLIGGYRLLQEIGEGGCGVVYMAEQTQPVKRRVALKVIKLGMDTKQVVARFEAERQALALMDHPNIAKVLDAGATEQGRPYFAMELVHGIRITDYCDQNNLSTSERLNLFMQVCHAVQHAHQKGIIHRDIKPSNILVTMQDGVPVPKVIDFGIAKATAGQTLTDKTLYTAFEQFIGTPAYMSPEQAEMSGLDIDTRSDIYSLGVLLYELLTGKTPFDTKRLFEAGLDEIRRIIREEEPPRPSTKISTLGIEEQTTTAKRRQTDAPRLIRLVRGDLDWIVMKCLEKDRTRRYDTANGLVLEIERHLGDEPVVARPPSVVYRIRKLAHRNKLALSVAAVTTALLAAVGGAVWSWTQEHKAALNESKMWLQTKAAEEKAHVEGITKLRDVRAITRAMLLYAEDNEGEIPEGLEQARLYIGDAGGLLTRTNQFEIVYRGQLESITNPSRVIILREILPWLANGRFAKAYGFADGHAEVRVMENGNFEAWERQRSISAPERILTIPSRGP